MCILKGAVMESVFSSIAVELVCAHFARLDRNWRDTDYSDNVSRIYWIDAGRGIIQHHGRSITLLPGRLYLIPAGTLFSFSCDKRLDQHWIHLTAKWPGGLPLFELLDPAYEVEPRDKTQVRTLVRRLEELFKLSGPAGDLEKTGILFMLLAQFIKPAGVEAVAKRRKAYLRFQDTIQHIERNLAGPLRISDVARIAHLERTYFSRLFNECLGVKPAEYVMRRRLERAKQRLWTTEEPLRAIAESLGFSDAFHLSKSFKRLTGMSPSDFRNMRGESSVERG
ncbi:MAG: hypothetical protein C0404_00915 [Verrucomicrobia bacterium]|nr:hypothetical protein [Verrucomicrobiota bacterium]